MLAFILVNVAVGRVFKVLEAIRKVKGVKFAYSVTGPIDIVVEVEFEKLENLKMIVSEIHAIEGVEKTTTCIAIE